MPASERLRVHSLLPTCLWHLAVCSTLSPVHTPRYLPVIQAGLLALLTPHRLPGYIVLSRGDKVTFKHELSGMEQQFAKERNMSSSVEQVQASRHCHHGSCCLSGS